MSTMNSASYAGFYFGYLSGLIGSLTPQTLTATGAAQVFGVYTGETAGQITCAVIGNVASLFAGKKLVFNGVDHPLTSVNYDAGSGYTTALFARATNFPVGNGYSVDVISAGAPPVVEYKYKGTRTRAQRYLGGRTSAQMELGSVVVYPT